MNLKQRLSILKNKNNDNVVVHPTDAKIYVGDQLLFQMRYLYFKKAEIIKFLKDRINNKDFKTTDDTAWVKDNLPQAKQLLEAV